MPRILPAFFWNPIRFTETPHPIVRFPLIIDDFFTNPYKSVLRLQDKCYITLETPSNYPLFQCIAKITLLVLFFFYNFRKTVLVTGALLIVKYFFRYAHPIERLPPMIMPPRISDQPRNLEAEKKAIIRWVQKQLCSDYFFLFALGITDTAFNSQLGEQDRTEQIEIDIGEETRDFPRVFLEKIPFFNALLRANMGDARRDARGKTVLHLSTQNPFSLSTLEKLQRFDRGGEAPALQDDDLRGESLDFLGLDFTLRVVRKFGNLREFQKRILGLNGNQEISELGIDPQTLDIPQVKVPSHDCKNIPFDNTALEEEIHRLEEDLDRLPGLRRDEVQHHCEQQRTKMLGVLEKVHRGPHSPSTLYLATNRLVESYLNHLRVVSGSYRQDLVTQEFLPLLDKNYSWHKYVTILTLPPEFDHTLLGRVTEKLSQLQWLTVSFFRNIPENPLNWILSWNKTCPQLRVLALSGLRYDQNVYNAVMQQMQQLEIFEIED